MTTKPTDALERHNVNLSRQVWGELKLRSFQEGISASELVAYVVERFAAEESWLAGLTRYQPRNPDEDRLGRTVFFPPVTWARAQALAAQHRVSVAGLIEFWLRRYLGMEAPEAKSEPDTPEGSSFVYPTYPVDPKNVYRVGEERVYLGENPIRIDLKTGKPRQEP